MPENPAAQIGLLDRALGSQAERPRLPRCGCRQAGAPADHRDRQREELVAVGGRVVDRRNPPARAKRPVDALQGAAAIGQVDQPEAGDDGVVGARVDLERLAVHLTGDDVGEPRLAGDAGCVLEDRRRDVGGQNGTLRTDALGGPHGLAAGSRGDVEDAGSGPDSGEIEHQLGRFAQPVLERRSPRVPRLRGLLPLLAGRLLVLRGVERGHRPCLSTRGSPTGDHAA